MLLYYGILSYIRCLLYVYSSQCTRGAQEAQMSALSASGLLVRNDV